MISPEQTEIVKKLCEENDIPYSEDLDEKVKKWSADYMRQWRKDQYISERLKMLEHKRPKFWFWYVVCILFLLLYGVYYACR
jgi:hypothetical protein